jgi:accessory gene regulator protein AgrB
MTKKPRMYVRGPYNRKKYLWYKIKSFLKIITIMMSRFFKYVLFLSRRVSVMTSRNIFSKLKKREYKGFAS